MSLPSSERLEQSFDAAVAPPEKQHDNRNACRLNLNERESRIGASFDGGADKPDEIIVDRRDRKSLSRL